MYIITLRITFLGYVLLTKPDFETFLDALTQTLTQEALSSPFNSPAEFEKRIRQLITEKGGYNGHIVDPNPHPHIFPDIPLGDNGIEVKFSEKDTWRSVANSIFESSRDKGVVNVYVIFGKMGGLPEVRWARYDDCVMHVRTSHVPRFELEIGAKESIFKKFGITYPEFQKLGIHEKMEYIRIYARGRLKKGERLWWLENDPDSSEHSLPIQARLYTSLTNDEKRQLRAEAALLCPEIVKGSRTGHKYDDVVLYALTYRGVLCHQARDLFSAGSVAGKERGGIYIQRSLIDIQDEMRAAALDLEDALFEEYWGIACAPENRIQEWLQRADSLCPDWKPSDSLFIDEQQKK